MSDTQHSWKITCSKIKMPSNGQGPALISPDQIGGIDGSGPTWSATTHRAKFLLLIDVDRRTLLKSIPLLSKSFSIRHVTLLRDRFPTDNAARYGRTSRCYLVGNCQPQILLAKEFDGADIAACLRGVFCPGESAMGISRFDMLDRGIWWWRPSGFFYLVLKASNDWRRNDPTK